MAGYLFGWLCFIACVICTLAKAAQWRDVAGYCAFLLGGSSMLIAVGFLGLAVIGHIQHKRYVKGGKALPKKYDSAKTVCNTRKFYSPQLS